MARRFKIEVVGTNVSAEAELQEDFAPLTSEALWGAMQTPIEAKAIHAMYAGREVFMDIPEPNRTFDAEALPRENASAYPVAGDVAWLYVPPNEERNEPGDVWDLAVVYGPEVTFDSSIGVRPISVWAHITKGLEELAVECARIRSDDGPKVLRLSRILE